MNNENLGAPGPRPLKCARQSVMLEFEHRLRDSKAKYVCGIVAAQGDIHRGFRSGPTTGRKRLQKRTARAGWSSGGDGI